MSLGKLPSSPVTPGGRQPTSGTAQHTMETTCHTPLLPWEEPMHCNPMLGLRRQMEFNSKKNKEVRTKLREALSRIEQAQDLVRDGQTHQAVDELREIKEMIVDVLVEL